MRRFASKLKVKSYDGTKSLWRDFEYTLGGFVGRESTKLAEAMAKVIDIDEEIKTAKLAELGVDPELDGKFRWLIQNNVEQGSKASTLVRTLKSKTGLEVWRRLSQDAKPKGGAQETLLKQRITKPTKAHTSPRCGVCRRYRDGSVCQDLEATVEQGERRQQRGCSEPEENERRRNEIIRIAV